MTKHEFRLRFSPSIRVNVNWRLLDEDAVTLRSVELELPEHLNLLWTPWFSTGAPAHKETETLSVTGAASDLSLLGEHREGVEKHVRTITQEPFEAPAVAIPKGRFMLLDKNHHLVAAAVRELRTKVTLHVLEAPATHHLLTDIARSEQRPST